MAYRWAAIRKRTGAERSMFSVNDRERIRDWVLHLAATDPRIVAGAVVGSLADTPGDRWSDLDLPFAGAEGVSVVEVLDDWTRQLVTAFDAVHLDLTFAVAEGVSVVEVLDDW